MLCVGTIGLTPPSTPRKKNHSMWYHQDPHTGSSEPQAATKPAPAEVCQAAPLTGGFWLIGKEPSLRMRTKLRNYQKELALCVIQASLSVVLLGNSWTSLELCPGADVFAFSHIHTYSIHGWGICALTFSYPYTLEQLWSLCLWWHCLKVCSSLREPGCAVQCCATPDWRFVKSACTFVPFPHHKADRGRHRSSLLTLPICMWSSLGPIHLAHASCLVLKTMLL